jgi:hypothetical protein
MDRRAIELARIELDRAADSIDRLRASNRREEIETQWSAFLTAAGRVFTKLEQGSKSDPKSQSWFGSKVHERRNDPLLRYLWHARNADEHTLLEVTEHVAPVIKAVTPTPEETANFHRAMQERQVPPYAVLGVIEVTPEHMRLRPVVDRGVTYYPPASPCNLPLNAGMLALSKLATMLQQAEALVAP